MGESHLDNTGRDAFTAPAFFALETGASYRVSRNARVRLQVNNVLNNRRIYPSGYSYQFMDTAGTIDGVRYYYPQATRHAVLTLDVGF